MGGRGRRNEDLSQTRKSAGADRDSGLGLESLWQPLKTEYLVS